MIWMVLLGLSVGLLGTLIGAGGGFILMPILLFLYPHESPEILTAISMAVICLNATSGTVAYVSMKRIDYRSGVVYALAAFPGAYLGAYMTRYVQRGQFDAALGTFLILMSGFITWRVLANPPAESHHTKVAPRLVLVGGALLSAFVGFLSSILGIGGGIIHVPALIYFLGFPVHVATATSHFVLACTSFVAVLEHLLSGNYEHTLATVAYVGVGVVLGAQFGARLSKRIRSKYIVLGLAVALTLAGARLVWSGL